MENGQKEVKVSAKVIKTASKSATEEELLALVKAEGLDCPEEMVKAYFAQKNKTGELADEELDNVVGGGCGGGGVSPYVCEDWDPVIRDDPYNRDDKPCRRCRHSGSAIWRSYFDAIGRDENLYGGSPNVPNSDNYCTQDDE